MRKIDRIRQFKPGELLCSSWKDQYTFGLIIGNDQRYIGINPQSKKPNNHIFYMDMRWANNSFKRPEFALYIV